MEKLMVRNPWWTVGFVPRETIRSLAGQPRRYSCWVLIFLLGLHQLLQVAQILSLGHRYAIGTLLIGLSLLALPFGFLSIHLMGRILLITGKMIKGRASFHQIYTAIAWSNVPITISLLFWAILIGLQKEMVFIAGYERELLGVAAAVNSIAALGQAVATIWAVVIFLHLLGEVQGFSSWISLLNVALGGIVSLLAVWMVGWFVQLV